MQAIPEASGNDFRSEAKNYAAYRGHYERFLRDFEDETGGQKYLNQLQNILDGRQESLHVSIQDFRDFAAGLDSEKRGALECLERNSYRAHTLMMEAAISVKSTLSRSTQAVPARAILDRIESAVDKLPAIMRATFDLYLQAPESLEPVPLRSVRSSKIGQLVRMQCVVAKCSSVQPRMAVARYQCQDCGLDAFQAVENRTFTPEMECYSDRCKSAAKRGTLRMIQRECRFRKHETVLVQEPTHHVPVGGVPWYMDVVVEGSLTRSLSPGMAVVLGGILVPLEVNFLQQQKQGNIQRTQFEVHSVEVSKKSFSHNENQTLEQLNAKLNVYDNDPNIYDRLANSIAPAIHGHLDVKKALLLQLVGGCTRHFADGLALRGDIHILLMGDPGVAKSQLLTKVAQLAPRSHYATGKGASGVGLTAAVTRDPSTGEFALEAGAIVLADRGICCIDEFDKMDERDRTAIHEVMEQQTVSVAKAGLTATLNARTSILAAANPASGRYDPKKSAVRNINLPAALLSRFDLQFLMLDKADAEVDSRIAAHITKVHMDVAERDDDADVIPPEVIRLFIERAKMYQPTLPADLIGEITEHYVDARNHERLESDFQNQNSYTTPRTLFAILRLSQALARLQGALVIDRSHLDEAFRLAESCKASVKLDSAKPRSDWRAEILDVIKERDRRQANRLGDEWSGWMTVLDLERVVIGQRGFTREQLESTLQEYVDFGVLQFNQNHKKVAFRERLVDSDEE